MEIDAYKKIIFRVINKNYTVGIEANQANHYIFRLVMNTAQNLMHQSCIRPRKSIANLYSIWVRPQLMHYQLLCCQIFHERDLRLLPNKAQALCTQEHLP